MYYGAFQFPNLMINLHPDSVMAYLLYPRAPGHTTVISEFYFRSETIEDPGFMPDSVVELWDIVSRQDWAVCERVQIGMARAPIRAVSTRARTGWSSTSTSAGARRWVDNRSADGAGAARPRSVVADVCALRTGVTLV